MKFRIADEIFGEHRGVILGVVVVRGVDNSADNRDIDQLLRSAETALPEKMGDAPVSQHPQIAPWREAYRQFGAKPKKYQSSIENLTRRVLKGHQVGHINNLVALYNVVSLRHIVPVGGEDLSAIQGDVLLRIAGEDEAAVHMLGESDARAPYAREIIYADDIGTICRRWNWKEADRTKLTHETTDAFFVIEGLPPVSREQIATAVADLVELFEKFCGGEISSAILDSDNRKMELFDS